MYPGSKVNWIDQTVENNNVITEVDNKALFLTASSFDKGPEDMVRVTGRKFYDLFGTNNRFNKHGQAAIQAARIIDAGGELLVKRIVADDATLANLVLIANVNNVTKPTEEDIIPSDAVTIPEQTVTLLGKTISELIGDDVVVAEDGSVYGTLHYVTGYKEFNKSKPEEQRGYFFPFTLNTTGSKMTFKKNGVETKKNINFDPEIIFSLDGSDTTWEVLVDGESFITVNFTNATFEPKVVVPSSDVSAYEQTATLLGKQVADLQSVDIVVDEDGSVYGILYHVENYTEFSSDVSLQTGNYFAFKLNTTGTTMTIKKNGTVTKDSVAFDNEIVFRIDDNNTTFEILVDGKSYIKLNFVNTVLDDGISTLDLEDDSLEDTEENTDIEVEMRSSVKWTAVCIENCYSYEEVVEEAKKLFDPENGVYPLMVITDNGRGESTKAVRISPNMEISMSVGKEFYTVETFEGVTRIDKVTGTLNETVYQNEQYGLDERTSVQVKFNIDSEVYEAYVAEIAEMMCITPEEVDGYDLINLTNLKGVKIEDIDVDTESIDFSVSYGVQLGGGSNGEFGSYPVDTPAWTQALIEFFSGEYTNAIYDLDEFKIGACVDANYPYPVKEEIARLATFREDFVFFRDMKLDANSYNDTLTILREKFNINNKFIADYMTYYQIYDPHNKKRIKVTAMYDIAACLVAEFNTGIHKPTAGIANGFILESAIEGTINFIPRILPEINQKQLMDDLRVNYAIFQAGQCIVQSLYTSQEVYSQLSYINNVLGIQEVVRSVRTSCPKKRYTFVDNGDFSEYAELVNNVLKNFKSNFDVLTFEYYQDPLLGHHKIFYGAIKFAFKDWAQSEIFDVYAIENNTMLEG